MTSNSTADNLCAPTDTLCIIKQHELEIIIVPALLLLGTLFTLVALCLLRYCPERKQKRKTAPKRYKSSSHKHTQRYSQRHTLQGIDAPPGLNPLEHEELPMSVQQVQQNVRAPQATVQQMSTERQHGGFSQVIALPLPLHSKPNEIFSLSRARMNNRGVIVRVLRETASPSEQQHFLDFAAFVSGLGPHPYLPALLGVVSVQSPLMMIVEELQHRDLLGFLWKCRKDNSSLEPTCEMTEKRIFTMAGQVASALEYLHSQSCIHGNVGARSILVGEDLTAKLWGLGSAYRRRRQAGSPGEVEDMEMRKWQAPEVVARRNLSQSSDVWSFGILLYEMVTLGTPSSSPAVTGTHNIVPP
ncbi:tyrosine-protein kinase STYK1 isoform X2 [Channa argus]|uniref:tyrosine-protein kinase STYK1 isoform X2 n=1 Tax=Channa argus TaxID=215402 RepID=UPI003521FE33